MDPKLIKAALEALKNDDGDAALALLEQAIANMAGGAEGEPPPAAESGAAQENADVPPEPKPEDAEQEAMAAMSRELVQLSGRATAGEAAAYFRDLHTGASKTAEDRSKLEASERRGLVAELVQLGVETPATAWERDDAGDIPEGDARSPKKRLRDEPIAELRSRIVVLRASRGGRGGSSAKTVGGERPPTGAEPPKLNAREIAHCKKVGITHEEFAAKKAGLVKRSQ